MTRGKRITKKQIQENIGEIPVFSSSKNEDSLLGKISKDFLDRNNLIFESTPSVLFNLDGSVGYCFVRDAPAYTYIDVVASLKIKNPQLSLDLEYIKIQLEKEIKRINVNYSTKFYFNKFTEYDIKFSIPVLANGEFDLEYQKSVVEKHNIIKDIRQAIDSYKEQLQTLNVLDAVVTRYSPTKRCSVCVQQLQRI